MLAPQEDDRHTVLDLLITPVQGLLITPVQGLLITPVQDLSMEEVVGEREPLLHSLFIVDGVVGDAVGWVKNGILDCLDLKTNLLRM